MRRFPLEAGVTPDFKEIDELARDEIAKLVLEKMCEKSTDRILFNDMNQLVSEASFGTLLSEIITKKSHFSSRASDTQIASFLGAPQDTPVEQLFLASFNDADLEFVKKIVPILRAGGASAEKLSEKLLLCTELSVEKFAILETVFLKSAPPFEPKIDKIGTKAFREGELAPYSNELNAFMQRIHDFKHAKNAIKSLNASITLSKFGCRFVELYEEEKQRRGWLDFEDLILKTKDLLSISAVAQWVLFRLDGGLTIFWLTKPKTQARPNGPSLKN